jgi:hypothetical protein
VARAKCGSVGKRIFRTAGEKGVMRRQISSSSEDRQFRQYILALFDAPDRQSLFEALSRLDVPRPYYARMKVVFSEQPPVDVVDRMVGSGRLQRLSKTSPVFLHKTGVGGDVRRRVQVPFAVLPFADVSPDGAVQAIVSVCKADEWQVLRRCIRSAYPKLVPILLSQAELMGAAKRLGELTSHSVQVRCLSAKERIAVPKSRARKTVREWTDEELDKVLMTVQDRHQLITSIDLEFFPRTAEQLHVVPSAVCRVRRSGEIEVDGSFALAFSTVANDVAAVGQKKLAFYAGRGLRQADYKPRPIAVTYAQPVFEDTAVVRGLVSLLTKYPHSMHAVIHGNPYAHVSVTDAHDFSSFEVWAIPPSKLAILPGLQASSAAFERLVDFVFERFREGALTEYNHGS